jgi:hypothetical protein
VKKTIIGLTLALSAGAASAQMAGPNLISNAPAAISTLVLGNSEFQGGLANSARPFLAGNTVDGFAAGNAGARGFAVELTRDTPAAPFGVAADQAFTHGYAVLLPAYVAADRVLIPLAKPGLPLTSRVADAIETFAQFAAIDGRETNFEGMRGLSDMSGSGTLPGLE